MDSGCVTGWHGSKGVEEVEWIGEEGQVPDASLAKSSLINQYKFSTVRSIQIPLFIHTIKINLINCSVYSRITKILC